jgi:hypothetical protein
MAQLMQSHTSEEYYGKDQGIGPSKANRLNASQTISSAHDLLVDRSEGPGNVKDDQKKSPVQPDGYPHYLSQL